MPLESLVYSEYDDTPRSWKIADATFSNINLVVGKNSTGKSRLLNVVNSFAKVITGQHSPFENCKFAATINIKEQQFYYEIDFLNNSVSRELLRINGTTKLERNADGSGFIWYEKVNDKLEFKLPSDAVAAVNRRDEIQHPYLMDLHQWATTAALYNFGSEFGRTRLLGIQEAESVFRGPNTPLFDDPDNLVQVYSSAFIKFGEEFDKAVISDMKKLGYNLTEVGSDNLQEIVKFPFAAIGMFTVESDLGFKVPQMHMSQGMFRALALTIHLNLCTFSNNKKLILVDDIGEGLDFDRAVKIIDLLIEKATNGDFQLIMTSNDRFVMNEVPLNYWSVLERRGGVVNVFNSKNSQETFEKFKYLGLNNFDFFTSGFFSTEKTQ